MATGNVKGGQSVSNVGQGYNPPSTLVTSNLPEGSRWVQLDRFISATVSFLNGARRAYQTLGVNFGPSGFSQLPTVVPNPFGQRPGSVSVASWSSDDPRQLQATPTVRWSSTSDGNVSVDSVSVQGSWCRPTLLHGWVAWDSTGTQFNVPSFSVTSDGWVAFRGLVRDGFLASSTDLASQAIFVLPAALCPSATLIFSVWSGATGLGQVRIDSSGNVAALDPADGSSGVSLDGIRFQPGLGPAGLNYDLVLAIDP